MALLKKQKDTIVATVTFFGGAYFFLEFILPKIFFGYEFGKYNDNISLGVTVVGTMAIGLGIYNIVTVHLKRIVTSGKDWIYSLALLIGFLLMFTVQSVNFYLNERETYLIDSLRGLKEYHKTITDKKLNQIALTKVGKLIESKIGQSGEELTKGFQEYEKTDIYPDLDNLIEEVSSIQEANRKSSFIDKFDNFLNEALFNTLGRAMFALLGFYIAAAAYRSFRVRNVESALMMATAVLVILGQLPFTFLSNFPDIRVWLLKNINLPGNRAIFFGSSIAGLILAFRMWFSLEKNPMND